jgi:cathepsin H
MGTCAADWAFSAVASVESLALFKNQSLILSEQQMVDCTGTYGNLACDNGEPFQAIDYIRDHGIATSAAYPYIEKR